MKAVLQRVKQARVVVAGETVGEIRKGILVFLAVEKNDGEAQAEALSRKIQQFRLFPSPEGGRMDLATSEVNGEFLVVSQFTLAANCDNGNRPSFDNAAPPAEAEQLYNFFVACLQKGPCRVATGRFRAMMDVELINDGPVTFILQGKGSF
ncbi:MAG: D-tyrosyl-tRNA(Tyr) deacylase [Candidatus Omnitrophica bacterium]|nr:D-tyrosyl-tRNA(Tyr) deacylase [Candidatus Omnitrophota bacterium]